MVHVAGIEPTATRLSGEALTGRTNVRERYKWLPPRKSNAAVLTFWPGPAGQNGKRRCLKPPFAAPPKETGTGQRAVLCPRRDGHPEEKSVHVVTRPSASRGSRVGGARWM